MKLVAALLAFLAFATAPAAAQIQPSQFSSFAFRQHPGAKLPLDAVLQDENGRLVRLGNYFEGKPVVLILDYLHCPNLCGLVLGGVVARMKAEKLVPGRDLQFVAVSIDPSETATDAKTALANYTGQYGAASPTGWHFLRGSADQVHRIASAVGFPYKWDDSLKQYAHPAGFVVATPDGRIAQYLLGVQQPQGALSKAVAGAATGATKPPAYPLLCLCLGYDPQPGTVSAIVLGIVRDISLTLLAACILLVLFLARRKKAA